MSTESRSTFAVADTDPRRLQLHDRTAASPVSEAEIEAMSDAELSFARWAAMAILALSREPGSLRVRTEAAEVARLLDRETDLRARDYLDGIEAQQAQTRLALPMHPPGSVLFAAGASARVLRRAEGA